MMTFMNGFHDAPEKCAPKRAGTLRGGLLRACLGLLLLLPLAGCDDGESLVLSVSGPAVSLQQVSRYAIVVYGYDPGVADAPASEILRAEPALDELPAELAIDWPSDAYTRIDQGYGAVAAEDARYYVKVYGDVDGDGEICAGDLVFGDEVDFFDVSFFGPELPDEPIAQPLKIADESFPCGPVFEG